MRYPKIITVILFLTLAPMLYAQNIADYQWKNRLIFLVDETMQTPAMRSQLNIFSTKVDELEERETLLFQLTPDNVVLSNGEKSTLSPNDVYASLSVSKNFKGLILVGKDGGVKLKNTFVVEADAVFSLIDGMPMRKSEIKRKKGD